MSEENTVENNSARESLRRMAIGRAEKLLEILKDGKRTIPSQPGKIWGESPYQTYMRERKIPAMLGDISDETLLQGAVIGAGAGAGVGMIDSADRLGYYAKDKARVGLSEVDSVKKEIDRALEKTRIQNIE